MADLNQSSSDLEHNSKADESSSKQTEALGEQVGLEQLDSKSTAVRKRKSQVSSLLKR